MVSHRTGYSSWEFIHAMNTVVENLDETEVKSANFVSLLIDDISISKNLMVYIQYFNRDLMSPVVKFVKNIPLGNCDADSVATAIKELFEVEGIDINKMAMITSDGAAVMLGSRNGVHTKLREFCPHPVEFHCVAHREALAMGQAYKSVRYFIQVENILIYSHFSHSSIHLEKLKLVFAVLENKFVRLKKLYDIHWLSRVEAIEAVVKSYNALVVYFDEVAINDSV